MKLRIPDYEMTFVTHGGEKYLKQSDVVSLLLSAASESDPDLRPFLSYIAEILVSGKPLDNQTKQQ